MKQYNIKMVPYSQGLGRGEEIKLISHYDQFKFNEDLEKYLESGWRIISELDITLGHNFLYYTIMLAKPRSNIDVS